MLNKLFHGSLGFNNGVRASAAFNFGLLAVAVLLMRTRLPPSPKKEGSVLIHMRQFFREPAYTSTVLGCVVWCEGCAMAYVAQDVFHSRRPVLSDILLAAQCCKERD